MGFFGQPISRLAGFSAVLLDVMKANLTFLSALPVGRIRLYLSQRDGSLPVCNVIAPDRSKLSLRWYELSVSFNIQAKTFF